MYLESVARFMKRRFDVQVDATSEVLALAGAKEGIAQLITATAGSGDVVLVPEIYYPVYARASLLAGAEVHFVPMRASTGFLADFDAVPRERASTLADPDRQLPEQSDRGRRRARRTSSARWRLHTSTV